MKKLALIALLVCVGLVGCEGEKKAPTGGSGSGSAAPAKAAH